MCIRDRCGHWRVIVPDLRGFGASDLGQIPGSLDDYADDLLALLVHLGLAQVVLCGLSMGGYISFALLKKAPERIKALILADTRAGADSIEGREGRLANAHKAETEGVLAVGEPMPVSYTHLDVYKRQVAERIGVGIAGEHHDGFGIAGEVP